MRLTSDIVDRSLSFINPLNERELELRGKKIPGIENFGSATAQECVDLTDNDIAFLGNFPLLPRLESLLCARNRITHIDKSLANRVPKLNTLVLSINELDELANLEPLRHFANLTHLSLIENPVTRKENYRYWVISLNPNVRFLDFQKVKQSERGRARELFGTADDPTDLARKIFARGTEYQGGIPMEDIAAEGVTNDKRIVLTEKQKIKFAEMLENTSSVKEMQMLEKAVNEGRLPPGLAEDDAMDET